MSGNKDSLSLRRAGRRDGLGASGRLFFALLLLVVFCGTSFAPIFMGLSAPQDSGEVRRAIADREELKGIAAEYRELIETRLCALKPEDIERIFVPQVSRPKDLVLPIYIPGGIAMSGARPAGTPDRSHEDMRALGDIGYAEFFYRFDGETLGAVILYHRAGRVAGPLKRSFVPLQSEDDFEARLEWDRQQFEEIKSWLAEHLPKATDLGVIQIANYTEIRLHLETGEDCYVGGGPFPGGDFCASVAAGPAGSREGSKLLAWNVIRHPDQPVIFPVAGKYYSITPKFPVVDLGTVATPYDVPTRLDVGTNQECTMTASLMALPSGKPYGISVRLQFHSGEFDPESQEWAGSWQREASLRDCAKPVVFDLDGRFYSFKLKITQ